MKSKLKIWFLDHWANLMLLLGNVEAFNRTIDKLRKEMGVSFHD